MISNLPKWYRILAIESIGEEILKKRSTAIETAANSSELPFLLDCIRYYLGKTVKSREFNKDFNKRY